MNAAIDFIESHLDERLDMAEAARCAAASPFHCQRMFHMLTGVTVAE